MITPYDRELAEDDMADLRGEARFERRYARALAGHPDCSDPDHPGCSNCDEGNEE